NETGYLVERQTGASGAWQQIAQLASNANAFADTSAAASTSYSYRVRATNSAGDSANSNTAAATTPAPPSFVYVSDLAWLSATNGWGPVEKDQSVGGEGSGDGSTLTL